MLRLRVKEIAQARGLNITELEKLTGLSYPTVHALWHGRTLRVELTTLQALSRALNVRVGELFTEESKNGDDAPFVDMGVTMEQTPELVLIPAR